MFDQVLQLVKQHIGNDPKISSAIPAEHKEDVHREVANGVTDGIKNTATAGGIGGMLSSVTGGSSGGGITSGIQKAVADRLAGKFGLSSETIHAITAALPGIVEKVTGKS